MQYFLNSWVTWIANNLVGNNSGHFNTGSWKINETCKLATSDVATRHAPHIQSNSSILIGIVVQIQCRTYLNNRRYSFAYARTCTCAPSIGRILCCKLRTALRACIKIIIVCLTILISDVYAELAFDYHIGITNLKELQRHVEEDIELYGGPEGPCPLPISVFLITNFEFSHHQLPIWIFLISNFWVLSLLTSNLDISHFQFCHYQLPIWIFLISYFLFRFHSLLIDHNGACGKRSST
jgi:hypothetical protein